MRADGQGAHHQRGYPHGDHCLSLPQLLRSLHEGETSSSRAWSFPTVCDSTARSYSVWEYSYFHFVNIPSVVKESSFDFFRAELNTYRKSLEKFTGKKITDEGTSLKRFAFTTRTGKRRRPFTTFAKQSRPSSHGATKLLTAGLSWPIGASILAEMKGRKEAPLKRGARILLDGPCVDNIEMIKLVEDLGGRWSGHDLQRDQGSRPWPLKVATQWTPSPAATWEGSIAPKRTGTTKPGVSKGILRPGFMTSGVSRKTSTDRAVPFTLTSSVRIPARKRLWNDQKFPLYLEISIQQEPWVS